jgi:hypothetical protein
MEHLWWCTEGDDCQCDPDSDEYWDEIGNAEEAGWGVRA